MSTDRINDILAIHNLKARYFRYLDTKHWAEWRTLFTDDLVFYMEESALPQTQEPISVGADTFVANVSELLAGTVTVHQGHMPEIEFTGRSTAHGIWAMFDWVDEGPEKGAREGYGHYHEDYEKGSDGQWRIKLLRLTRLRHDSVPGSSATGERPQPPAWSVSAARL